MWASSGIVLDGEECSCVMVVSATFAWIHGFETYLCWVLQREGWLDIRVLRMRMIIVVRNWKSGECVEGVDIFVVELLRRVE